MDIWDLGGNQVIPNLRYTDFGKNYHDYRNDKKSGFIYQTREKHIYFILNLI